MRPLTTIAALITLGASLFAAAPVPRPAKELEIAEPNGKHDLLTNYKGKVVVVQFLFTTCPHCQAYSQLLTKLQNEYGPKGFQALGAAFNEADNNMVSNYINQYKVGFPIGPVQRETVLSFLGFQLTDRLVVPQIALIDRKGIIREQTEANPSGPAPLQDEAHLRAAIQRLLAEGAPAKGAASKAPSGAAKTPSGTAKKPVSRN